jgi:anti-sigma factor RsiW
MTIRPEELDPAALIRCGADDELCEAGKECLREHLEAHPEDRARLEFDHELRGAVGRVMRESATPEGLCDRIKATLADHAVADALEQRSGETRSKSFWARPFGSIVSVAATLVLAFVLVQIVTDVVGGSQAHAAEVRSFVGSQHRACVIETGGRKWTMSSEDEVVARFEELTSKRIDLSALTACSSRGLRFVAAGECGVPPNNRAKSMHLRFESDGTSCDKGMTISLFIQPYVGFIEMEPGRTYTIAGKGDHTVYGWTDGVVVFYVVADADAPCEAFREAAGQPEAQALPQRSE